MTQSPSRRARLRTALVAVTAALVLPASAQAIEITSFKAGPVAPYNNGAGLPFIPAPAPAGPAALPPAGTVAPSVLSADTNCAYGKPQDGRFFTETTPTWNPRANPTPPTLGTTTANQLPVYSTAAADEPLVVADQAGVYSDYCVAFRTSSAGHPSPAAGGERTKQTIVELPVGVAAGIDPQVKCSEADYKRHSATFEPAACPRASQVGTATVRLAVPAPVAIPGVSDGNRAVRDSPGRVFALETPANLAARFGVVLLGGSRLTNAGGAQNYAIPDRETKFLIDVSQAGVATIGLLNATDELAKVVPNAGGLPANTLSGSCAPGSPTAPNPVACVVPIQLAGGAFRFWGKATAHPHKADPMNAAEAPTFMATDFLRLPTTCQKDLTSKLTVVPYAADQGLGPMDAAAAAGAQTAKATSNAVRLTGCESLKFDPGFSAELTGETDKGGHPGLKLNITVPEGQEDLGATKITLPDGVATDLKNIQNGCLPADFAEMRCAPETIIGSVAATLSGIDADVVKGDIHMVRVEGETLPALGFNFKGRLPLRLSGISKIDANGRIVNTFVDLPSIPQRSLSVTLNGGPKGILQISPDTCKASAFEATLTGQNGKTKSFKQTTLCNAEFRATLKRSKGSRPYLSFSGAGATTKKIQSIRLTLPGGLTVRKGSSAKRTKVDKLEKTVTGDASVRRLDKKRFRVNIPQTGSNGLRILTRSTYLTSSKKFRRSDNAPNISVRVVYKDGTKETVKVPLKRN